MQKLDQTSKVDKSCARGRGRPRSFDREAALVQATRLFWIKGFEATSIADLTKVMGIGAPSLYAAFGSKEALYVEALHCYVASYERFSWARFEAAATVREAVESYLMDSAAALSGSFEDMPQGCMVTLSSVGSEGHSELGELVRSERAAPLERLKARLARAVVEGELQASVDVPALARFVQTVQSGMSILARDGTSRTELEVVAQTAMLGWDARTDGRDNARP